MAARLPTDGVLNVAWVDVADVRRSIGMKPEAVPPTTSDDADRTFIAEVEPALGILQSGRGPAPIVDGALAQADAVASVTGDRVATAVATSADTTGFEDLLRSTRLREEDSAFSADDGSFSVAVGEGLIAFAEDPDTARSTIESDGADLPDPLRELDTDAQLFTFARFASGCVSSIATADTVGEEGEVSFVSNAIPEATRVQSTGEPPRPPVVVGDAATVAVAAATGPDGEPPAVKALAEPSVDYDCG